MKFIYLKKTPKQLSELTTFLALTCWSRYQNCRIWANPICARQKCSCAPLRRGKATSLNRLLKNFLWIPLKFCGQQKNRKLCGKILNRGKWMAELGCRVASQPSSGCVSTMSMDQKSFSEYGAHSAALLRIPEKLQWVCLHQKGAVPWADCAISDPCFCFWWEVKFFCIPIPIPVSHFNLLFFGHRPLPLCSLNSLCSLLYNSLSSTLLFLLLALSSLHHYSRHFSPLC